MSTETSRFLKFGSVIVLIVVSLGFLAYTGVQDSKSYYVTIKELNGMGNEAYAKRLRVAGNVVPGSIKRSGTRVDFMLKENELTLPVSYTGTEAPPDTFKDDSQALAASDVTASFMPSNCRPSALRNMRRRRDQLRQRSLPRACRNPIPRDKTRAWRIDWPLRTRPPRDFSASA